MGKMRGERGGAYRGNPELRFLANTYVKRGYEAVDAVRRAIEDLFPRNHGERLEYPGVGVWSMGEERLAHRIPDNLRALRTTPGVWAGAVPYREEDEEEEVFV